MANVLRHPHFDRPPVANPNKRRRKGTIDLGKVRRHRECLMAHFGTLDPADDARGKRAAHTTEMRTGVRLDVEACRLSYLLNRCIDDLAGEELVEVLEAIKAIKARRNGGQPAA